MAKVINERIPNIDVSWENYSGESVETFVKEQLKSKAGYFYRTPQKIGDYYYLYGFYNQESWEEWMETADNALILCRVQLPNLENDTFSATLATTSNTDKLVNLGEGVVITLQYKSYSTNPTTHEVTDTYNDGTLIIMRSANGAPWSTVGRVTMSPVPYASSQFVKFDLTPYIVDGDNKIRLRVEDNVNGSISNNVQFASVIDTTLAIRNATPTQEALQNLSFRYYIEGQVPKTLNLKITDSQGHQETFSQAIGSNTYIETPYQYNVTSQLITNGVIEVDAWLTVDDTILQSDHIINQFYYYQGSGDTAIVLLNNVNRSPANYTTTKLFDFVVYNKTTNVVIRVTDGTTTFLQYTYYNCVPGTVYNFVNTLEVESEAETVQLMYTATTSDMTATEYFTLDNSENFNPTAGADFILNPKLHNNSEAHPNTIINEVTGQAVTSTWNNFSFGTGDGWVQNDLGYPVLRVPAGRKLTINYDSLDNTTEGTTIELDYMVYGVFDDNEEVLRIGKLLQNGNVLGLTMRALDGNFMTQDNQSARDQDFHFGENRRMHLAVNILPNVSGSGLNYVRLFINGIINREFQYTANDAFHTDVIPIIIGAENNDIDIFSIRVYKKGLSASDVRQDYMSSIPTTAEKVAYKTANDILSANGTISYEKARVKYNTLVWTGQHPEYWTGNVKYRGDLKIEIVGDPAHSGTLKNVEIGGQGSSSRGYWKWNHTHKIKSDSVILDNDGNVLDQKGWQVLAGTPYAKRLVSKRNWASSSQSHKIGATKLYNDLWKAIVGGNSITRTQGYEDVRNAVIEVPFLQFFRDNENATPVFDGFSTWGSAKHDEPTFWGSIEAFPDYMMMEGSDNGIPLTLFQVPWFEDEVHYSSDDEAFVYANMVSWDWEDGNDRHEYWVPMHNFIYEHSTRLRGFTGDATTLNNLGEAADKSYQYYNTTNGKVYRYDYIGQGWVNGGTTKTNGQYDELNIFTQTGLTSSATVDELKAARVAQFKAGIGNYINVNDHLYSMQFVKMIAASDNWCKNTFFYLDPVTHKWCLLQDDLDTIFATDNVGRNTKPYWVEEHDTFDNGTKYYWNGEDNVFFNLMQEAYETELRAMMKTILDTMASSAFGNGSATKCMDDYFFSVQKYFPAVAYNETARLLYEEAAQAQAAGQYTNGTPPLSQSMGDMLSCEEAFWERRGIYLASYASSSPFYVRSTGSLGYRSIRRTDATNPTYRFQLKPWIYLYPKTGIGQSMAADNTRVPAGTVYQSLPLSTDGNTDCFIYGADYYTDFGEFGGHAIGEAFNLSGQHLRRFSADSRVASDYQFRPLSMTVLCPNLQYFCLYGCSTLSGSLDLRDCKKIITLDLRGTGLTGVMFPESDTLTTANVPGLTSVTIKHCPALSTFYSTNISALQSLTTDNQAVLDFCLNNATNLTTVVLDNVTYSTSNAAMSQKMYDLLINENTTATGNITITGINMTMAMYTALTTKYGNIDSPDNQLHVVYNVSSGDASITGNATIAGGSYADYTLNYAGSDFSRNYWAVSGESVDHYEFMDYLDPTNQRNPQKVRVYANDNGGQIMIQATVERSFGHETLQAYKTVKTVARVYANEIVCDNVFVDLAAGSNTATATVSFAPANYNIAITDVRAASGSANFVSITNVVNNNNGTWTVNMEIGDTSSHDWSDGQPITTAIVLNATDAENNALPQKIFNCNVVNDVDVFVNTINDTIDNGGSATITINKQNTNTTVSNFTITGSNIDTVIGLTPVINGNTISVTSSRTSTTVEQHPLQIVGYYTKSDGTQVTKTIGLTLTTTPTTNKISFACYDNEGLRNAGHRVLVYVKRKYYAGVTGTSTVYLNKSDYVTEDYTKADMYGKLVFMRYGSITSPNKFGTGINVPYNYAADTGYKHYSYKASSSSTSYTVSDFGPVLKKTDGTTLVGEEVVNDYVAIFGQLGGFTISLYNLPQTYDDDIIYVQSTNNRPLVLNAVSGSNKILPVINQVYVSEKSNAQGFGQISPETSHASQIYFYITTNTEPATNGCITSSTSISDLQNHASWLVSELAKYSYVWIPTVNIISFPTTFTGAYSYNSFRTWGSASKAKSAMETALVNCPWRTKINIIKPGASRGGSTGSYYYYFYAAGGNDYSADSIECATPVTGATTQLYNLTENSFETSNNINVNIIKDVTLNTNSAKNVILGKPCTIVNSCLGNLSSDYLVTTSGGLTGTSITLNGGIVATGNITANDIVTKGDVNISGTITANNSLDYQPTDIVDTEATVSGSLTALTFKAYTGGTSALTTLDVSGCTALASLDVSNNTNLTTLKVNAIPATLLNVSGCSSLSQVKDGSGTAIGTISTTTLNAGHSALTGTPSGVTNFTPSDKMCTESILSSAAHKWQLPDWTAAQALNINLNPLFETILATSYAVKYVIGLNACSSTQTIDYSNVSTFDTIYFDYDSGSQTWLCGTSQPKILMPASVQYAGGYTYKEFSGFCFTNFADNDPIDIYMLGNIKTTGSTIKNLNITCSQGNIKVNKGSHYGKLGVFAGKLKMHSNCEIQIGGTTWPTGILSSTTIAGSYQLTIKQATSNATSGSITLKFDGTTKPSFSPYYVTGSGNIIYVITGTLTELNLANDGGHSIMQLNVTADKFNLTNAKIAWCNLVKATGSEIQDVISGTTWLKQMYVSYGFNMTGLKLGNSANITVSSSPSSDTIAQSAVIDINSVSCNSLQVNYNCAADSYTHNIILGHGNDTITSVTVNAPYVKKCGYLIRNLKCSALTVNAPEIIKIGNYFCSQMPNLMVLTGPIGKGLNPDPDGTTGDTYASLYTSMPTNVFKDNTSMTTLGTAYSPIRLCFVDSGGSITAPSSTSQLMLNGCTALNTIYWIGSASQVPKAVVDVDSLPTGTLNSAGGDIYDNANSTISGSLANYMMGWKYWNFHTSLT